MIDLLPCPVCGLKNALVPWDKSIIGNGDGCCIVCLRCIYTGPQRDTAEGAAAAWNEEMKEQFELSVSIPTQNK